MKPLSRLLALPLSTLLAAVALSAELGDAAPALDIKEWIKGGPVDLAAGKGKTVHVVEFWATWCGPCRTSIPHLTELQKRFKDKGVVFIGVSNEKSDVVKKFVTKMGDKMDYAVAIDGGKTSEGYMEAFNINGIPHAFVVDKDGRIVWQGHPMAGLDSTLEKVVNGKYDLAAAKAENAKQAAAQEKEMAAQKKLQKLAKLIGEGRDDAETKKLEEELVALDKEQGGLFNGQAFEPADFRKRVAFMPKFQKYQQALMSGEDPTKLAALEKELVAGAPKGFDLDEFKTMFRNQMELQKVTPLLEAYLEAVGENGDPAKAADALAKIDAAKIQSGMALNQLAWSILTAEEVKKRDLPAALRFAKQANDLAKGEDAAILDTYARALFDNGKTQEAIATQKKAIEKAPEQMKEGLEQGLKNYEAKAK